VIIDNFQIFKYSLPLHKPLYVRGDQVNEREGFIIKISTADASGFGDIAPLSGLSKESIDDCLAQLKQLQAGLIGAEIPNGLAKLTGGFKKWVASHKPCSSVQFGLELAVLNLLASRKGVTLCDLISENAYNYIAVTGLLEGSKEELRAEARDLINQGYHTLKLKVTDNVEEAIAKVLAINPIIEGKAVLHVDPNQSWSIAQAVHFSHEVGLTTVDYIEEPFDNLKDISAFFMKTTIPIALDETLLQKKIEDIRKIDGLEVLVLKPTLLGGLEYSFQLIQQARSAGLSTVISSCFESSVGIYGLVQLAAVSSRHKSAGLDTLKWFKSDTLKKPLSINHGRITVKKNPVIDTNINYKILSEVTP